MGIKWDDATETPAEAHPNAQPGSTVLRQTLIRLAVACAGAAFLMLALCFPPFRG